MNNSKTGAAATISVETLSYTYGDTISTLPYDSTCTSDKYVYSSLTAPAGATTNQSAGTSNVGAGVASLAWTYNYNPIYTIKYNSNYPSGLSGGGTVPNTTHVWNTSGNVAGNSFTLEGYDFKGWYPNADGTGKLYNAGADFTNWHEGVDGGATVNLYAKWDPRTYTISYAANSGTGSTAAQTVTYNSEVTLQENGFTRTGHTFMGWDTMQDGNGTRYGNATNKGAVRYPDDSSTWSETANLTLYAIWESIKYTLKYDLDGGSLNGSNWGDREVIYGTSSGIPFTPTVSQCVLTGSELMGWDVYIDGELKGFLEPGVYPGNTQTDINNAEVVLKAVWTKGGSRITYNGNGAESGSTPATNTIFDDPVDLALNGFAKTGYTFKEWNEQADGLGVSYAEGSDYGLWQRSAPLTLYAIWTANEYRIDFNANVGAGSAEDSVTESYDAVLAADDLPAAPTRPGYTFVGWFDTPDLEGGNEAKAGITVSKTEMPKLNADIPAAVGPAVTYYARWQANTYLVKYDPVTGSSALGSVPVGGGFAYVTYDKTFGDGLPEGIPNAICAGYEFDGWVYGTSTDIEDDTSVDHTTLDEDRGAAAPALPTDYAATYTAKWKPKVYTVVYDCDGGDIDGDFEVSEDLFYNGTYTLPEDDPVRNGYTFLGWFTAKGAGTSTKLVEGTFVYDTAIDTTKQAGEPAITFYANWEKNDYTILFDLKEGNINGSTDDIINPPAPYGSWLIFPADPRRTGYTFTGWFNEENVLIASGAHVDDSVLSAASLNDFNEPTTLHAVWEPVSYPVIWELDGGNILGDTTNPSTNETYDELYHVPDGPEKEDHTFLGWYTERGGGGYKIEKDVTIVSDATLSHNTMDFPDIPTTFYANWIYAGKYGLEYDDGMGNITSYSAKMDDIFTIDENMPADPQRLGYEFRGWWTEAGGTGVQLDPGVSVVGENTLHPDALDDYTVITTYYAHWEAITYTVKFDAGEGQPTGSSDTLEYNEAITLPTEPTREGYAFGGWWFDDGSNPAVPIIAGLPLTLQILTTDSMDAPGTAVTVYTAKWTALNYAVVWQPQGGKISGDTGSASGTATYGSKFAPPADPTLQGYRFQGWFTEKTGGDPVDDQTDVKAPPLSDASIADRAVATNFYAQWKANVYDVRFDADGGAFLDSETDKTEEQTYDAAYVLPAEEPDREGYEFAGWFQGKNGTGLEITAAIIVDGSTLNSDAVQPDLATTFYAKWTQKEYQIVFNSNGGDLADQTRFVKYGDKYTMPQPPSLTGHSFLRWETSGGDVIDSSVTADSATMSTSTDPAATFYAKWQANQYHFVFLANGGSFADSSVQKTLDVTYGEAITCPANPELTDYTFGGWFTEDGVKVEDGALADDSIISPLSLKFPLPDANTPTVLRAKWLYSGDYSVVYELNGGDVGGVPTGIYKPVRLNEITPETFALPDPAVAAENVLRTGYTLTGWNTKADGTGYTIAGATEVTRSTLDPATLENPSEPTRFYAQWQANSYNVLYHSNEGAGSAETTLPVVYGEKFAPPAAPTRAGYLFTGWKASGTVISSAVTANDLILDVTADPAATVYAQWDALAYTLIFDADGGTVGGQNETTFTGQLYDNPQPVTGIALRDGYTFGGWYTERGGKGTPLSGSTVGDALSAASKASNTLPTIYYAWWKTVEYSVKFDPMGGAISGSTAPTAPEPVSFMGQYHLPATPVKTGHSFVGWNTKNDGTGTAITQGKQVDFTTLDSGVLLDPTVATTFYAVWAKKSYDVTYQLQGGNVGGSSADIHDTLSYGQAYQDGSYWPGTDPAVILRDGYTFGGWYTSPDGPVNGSLLLGTAEASHLLNENAPTLYYAYWNPVLNAANYTVAFYLEDADGNYPPAGSPSATSTLNGTTGSVVTVSGSLLGDALYVFDEAAANVVADILSDDGSTTLVLYYRRATFSLRYHLDGGTGLPDPAQRYRWGQIVTIPNDPTRVGYAFDQWDPANIDGPDAAVTNGSPATVKIGKGDTMVYAKWTAAPFQLTLMSNGVAYTTTFEAEVGKPFNYHDILPATMDAGPEWRFIGWSYDGATMIDPNQPVPSTRSPIYACYVRNYIITYNANGGTIDESGSAYTQRQVWYLGNYGQAAILDAAETLPIPKATNGDRTFLYWYYVDQATGTEMRINSALTVHQLTSASPVNPAPSEFAVQSLSTQNDTLTDDLVIYAKWSEPVIQGGCDCDTSNSCTCGSSGCNCSSNTGCKCSACSSILPGIIGGVVGGVVGGTVGFGAGFLSALGFIAALLVLPVTFLLVKLAPSVKIPDWLLLPFLRKDKEPEEETKDTKLPELSQAGSETPAVQESKENEVSEGAVKPPHTGSEQLPFLMWTLIVTLLSGGGLVVLLRRRRESEQLTPDAA